jgi:hypothetical protein
VLSAEHLLQRLEHDVLSPTIGRRDLPARQQTMNATVAWSYQLLEADEQRAFRRLGVLPGLFPIEAAAAVQTEDGTTPAALEHAQRTVAGLVERSLLQCVGGSCATRPLYRMLETVRAYAGGELTDSGERDVAMEGLARFCVTAAAAAGQQMMAREQGAWLDRVRDDLESVRSALSWLIEHDRHTEACEIVWQLMFFWLIRGHTVEGLRWYEQVTAATALPPSSRAAALAGTSVMWYAQGELVRARDACEQSLMLAAGSTTMAVAIAEVMLGHVELSSGNLGPAVARFTIALARFDDLGFAWGTSNALAGLARAALAADDLTETDRLLGEASAALSEAVGAWSSLLVLYVRALLAVRRNHAEEAIAHARDSIACVHSLNDRFALLYALTPLAAAAELTGDDAWVARIVGIRDAVTERTGARAVDESVRDLWERIERDAHARLGQRRWAREHEIGRGASMESLLKEVDERIHLASR